MGYETIELYEKLPPRKKSSINVPDGFFIRPKTLAIFDDIKNEITLINPYWYQNNQNYEKDYELIVDNLKKIPGLMTKFADDSKPTARPKP